MKLVRYNQFDPQVPNTFSGILDRIFQESFGANQKQFSPAVDIAEDEKSYEIHIAVPGMKKEDFKVDLVDSKITISGERKFEEKKEGKNFHSVESHYGSFRRSFFLPEDVIQDHVEASYQDGVLKLTLPKQEKKTVKSSIEVK